MYFTTPADPFFHLSDGERFTLCGKHLTAPDQRRRFGDYRLADRPPTDRVSALCSRCAELSGDYRGLRERLIYPPRPPLVFKRPN